MFYLSPWSRVLLEMLTTIPVISPNNFREINRLVYGVEIISQNL
jgi:hypothetical protein